MFNKYIDHKSPLLYLLVIYLFVMPTLVFSQDVLSLEAAKEIAINQNYGAQISKQNIAIIENNTRMIKTGRKPNLFLNAGLNGNVSNTITKQFAAPEQTETWLAPSMSTNISASSNYLLWDNHLIGNKVKQNEALKKQAGIALEATQENVLFQVENIYINILELLERQALLEESIEISHKRKMRAQYAFEYGQSNKLNLLNATVDLNRDSLDLVRFNQQVVNLKRNLNLLLNRDIYIEYSLEPIALLSGVDTQTLETYTNHAISNNLDILHAQEALNISYFDRAINNSNLKPKVFANASYGINYLNNTDANFIDYNLNDGLRLGLSTTWNILDGGRTKILNENSELKIKTQNLIVDQLTDQIRMSIANSWADYENALKIHDLEEYNVATAEENFTRSQELFNQGQINSITFRQAQLNLLNANLSKSSARYDVKLLKLDLMRLSGMIK